MQHSGWRSAIHRRKVGAALLAGILLVTAVIGTLLAQLQGTASEVVLYPFKGPSHGGYPQAGVVRDRFGNLYGTSQSGGATGQGVVFRVDPAGHYTVLHNFTGGSDGQGPVAGVIGDSAGNLYGTTINGGITTGVCAPLGCGVVFKLDPTGHETVLYAFTGGADGGNPRAGVVRDRFGDLYGTTSWGGIVNSRCIVGCGVVYKLDAAGHETVLYRFTGGSDGQGPDAGAIGDSAGNLYGTTPIGGITTGACAPLGCGVVFKLDPAGHETVLHSFTGGSDGDSPQGVIGDGAGNFYGTTYFGGAAGRGVVFRVDPTGHEAVLYSFSGGADGGYPHAGVIRDRAGNLYGTTYFGGITTGVCAPSGCGVVFRLDTAGHETVLYSFTGGAGGGNPQAAVIGDGNGNLYGTTSRGSLAGWGVVYKLDSTGHETALYNFSTGDGNSPQGGVIGDGAGNLYGTTNYGGNGACAPLGCGIVFKLDAAGHETVLYSFTGGADGGNPYGSLIRDSAGNLYGTTSGGGSGACNGGCGVVFKLDSAGHYTVLYSFTGGLDGAGPQAGLISDSAGNLYGTSYRSTGGICEPFCQPFGGTVFKLDPSGSMTVLYSFTGGADGGNPHAGVIGDSAGNLYGTTYQGGADNAGVVYKLDPTGHETVLYSFAGGADGGNPQAGVIRDSAGNLYGTTAGGGITTGVCQYSRCGVVYKIDPTGHETVLHSFTHGSDGAGPFGSVVRDSAGNLYGTTVVGGPANAGVVFKLDPTGHETVLYSFTGGADGRWPSAGLIPDAVGNLYGTTANGGPADAGVVFRIEP